MWEYCQFCDYAKIKKRKVWDNELGKIDKIEVTCTFKTVRINFPLCFPDIFEAAEIRWLIQSFPNN